MAKKFKFPLEQVLKVRSLRRKQCERELVVIRNQIHKTEQEIQYAKDQIRNSFSGPTAMTQLWSHAAHTYRKDQEERIQDLYQTRKKLEKSEQETKAQLIQKMRDEKVMLQLKDKQKEAHQREVESQIQKEMEELDILKRGRK
ncbi:MAG: hypothetical protein KDC71_24145 [Acidobacteria bacterium]|nr:hypothetical protein [Acidobacteriota bacterium]